jgi:uncharacterized protein involved in exopolysaccharide biosynthesis
MIETVLVLLLGAFIGIFSIWVLVLALEWMQKMLTTIKSM